MSTHDDFRSVDTTPRRFGLCYQCIDGAHSQCFGVPCDCACPTPAREPALDPDEVRRAIAMFNCEDRPLAPITEVVVQAAEAWLKEHGT